MNGSNKSYFDKHVDPIVREIDRVNIYEFEKGMDYEMTTSGKAINIDTIKEAQSKVLKNLKKSPTFYTDMLVNETIKMVGEYGSGKKPGVRNTAKSAEAVKKDGKINKKPFNSDAPYGKTEPSVKGKYKSSGMEPAKKVKGALKEGMDYSISNQDTSDDPAYYSHGTTRSFENTQPDPDQEILDRLKKQMKDVTKPKGMIKKEGVDVQDSRTIRLTKSTKNDILNLVREAVNAMVTDKTGTHSVSVADTNALNTLRGDSNVSSITTTAGQKVK